MSLEEVVRTVARLGRTVASIFGRLEKIERMLAILAEGHENEELKKLVVQKDKGKEFKKFISKYAKRK